MSSTEICGLPDEIITYIFALCDIPSIYNLSSVCKRFSRCTATENIWKERWRVLAGDLGVSGQIDPCIKQGYREVCRRFVAIFGHSPNGQPVELTCTRCLRVLCQEYCMQDREEIIVFDFGSKISYFKYASESTGQLSMHPTVSPLPAKTLPSRNQLSEDMAINLSCPVCAKIVRRRVAGLGDPSVGEKMTKVAGNPSRISSALSRLSLRTLHCFDTSNNVNDGTALLPDSELPLSCLLQRTQSGGVQTISSNGHHSIEAQSYETCMAAGSDYPMSPSDVQMKTYKFLIHHMLKRNPFFQVHNIPFVICEPTGCSPDMKTEFVKFLLCDLKVPGVCFIPKPVATSLYLGLDLCLVIDSGANNTVVACVVDQTVLTQSVVHKAIGGSRLTRQLMDCLKPKCPDVELDEAGIDSSQVKKECYLAYNPNTEAKRKLPPKSILVKGSKDDSPQQCEVQLCHELYVLAEDMYLSIDYIDMVMQSLEPFDNNLKMSLLGNILLTGGNNRLNGLSLRLTKDLQTSMPDCASSVRVADTRLMTGKTDALIGASYIKKWVEARWITRSDFILDGIDCLQGENIV